MKKIWKGKGRVCFAAACGAAAVTLGTMTMDHFNSKEKAATLTTPAETGAMENEAIETTEVKETAESIETTENIKTTKSIETAENIEVPGQTETPGYVVHGADGGRAAVLSENEYRLIEILYEKMSENDRAGAAEHMNKNESQFRRMFEETLEGKACFFDGSNLKRDAKGAGMVLRHPTTVFFGNFGNNGPEGECLALKAMVLDYPRYDYSDGIWKNGVMEGKGKVGYICYDGTDGTETPEIEKEGYLKNDRMDGPVTYKTTNSDGVSLVWELEAEEGKTLLSDLWEYDEGHDDYRLLSKNDTNRAFSLKKSEINSVRWMNMIKWKE